MACAPCAASRAQLAAQAKASAEAVTNLEPVAAAKAASAAVVTAARGLAHMVGVRRFLPSDFVLSSTEAHAALAKAAGINASSVDPVTNQTFYTFQSDKEKSL